MGHRAPRKAPLAALTVFLALAVCAAVALAIPGDLDPTFGSGGRFVMQMGTPPGSTTSSGYAGAVLPDGKLVMAGNANDANNHSAMFVARLNPDGTLDSSFGSGGKTLIQASTTGDSSVRDMAVQPDGKIVLAGDALDSNSHDAVAIARVNADGSPDSSFGSGGAVLRNIGQGGNPNAYGMGVALQPDGKIVVAGGATDSGGHAAFAVVRVMGDNGAPDALFGNNGLVTHQYGATSAPYSEADDVAIQPDGKIVAAGAANDGSGNFGPVVVRLNPGDGGFDGSFAGGGAEHYTNFGKGAFTRTYANVEALQPDGKILLGGTTSDGGGHELAFVGRLNTDGSLDQGFGTDGQVIQQLDTGTAESSSVDGMALQPDSKIVLVGDAQDTNNKGAALVARLRTDGALDTSFGNAGRIVNQISSNSNPASDMRSAVIQPDGKVFAVGYGNGDPTGSEVEAERVILDVPPTAAFTAGPNPAQAGQAVAFDGATSSDSDGAIAAYSWDFGDGSPAASGSTANHTYAQPGSYNATLTVRDDYGLTSATSHAVTVDPVPAVAAPPVAPALAGLSVKPRKFPAAPKGATVTRKTGATVRYSDTRAATTKFTVKRAMPGVRKGKRCVKPTTQNKRGKKCTRWVVAGSFKHVDVAGPNKFHFTGRIHRRKLPPGKYRLYATPTAGALTGKTDRTSFQIIS